jgi:hypothetical protein
MLCNQRISKINQLSIKYGLFNSSEIDNICISKSINKPKFKISGEEIINGFSKFEIQDYDIIFDEELDKNVVSLSGKQMFKFSLPSIKNYKIRVKVKSADTQYNHLLSNFEDEHNYYFKLYAQDNLIKSSKDYSTPISITGINIVNNWVEIELVVSESSCTLSCEDRKVSSYEQLDLMENLYCIGYGTDTSDGREECDMLIDYLEIYSF